MKSTLAQQKSTLTIILAAFAAMNGILVVLMLTSKTPVKPNPVGGEASPYLCLMVSAVPILIACFIALMGIKPPAGPADKRPLLEPSVIQTRSIVASAFAEFGGIIAFTWAQGNAAAEQLIAAPICAAVVILLVILPIARSHFDALEQRGA